MFQNAVGHRLILASGAESGCVLSEMSADAQRASPEGIQSSCICARLNLNFHILSNLKIARTSNPELGIMSNANIGRI